MTLTQAHGPLSATPSGATNYQITGPAHRLYLEPFPRRVRAVVAGETVVDTRAGGLLYETGLLPQLYVPVEDVRADLLVPSEHTTHCPFKGEASYRSLRVGDRRVDDAMWEYPTPRGEASWLRGLVAFYWDAVDSWLDEDEEVLGRLRDLYHRVDVRPTRRHLRVTLGGSVIAETDRPMVLSETGLPNRYYIPRDDVRAELAESPTRTVCPYKGTATYCSPEVDGRRLDDAGWYYPEPLEEATRVRGHVSFDHDALTTEVDGQRLA